MQHNKIYVNVMIYFKFQFTVGQTNLKPLKNVFIFNSFINFSPEIFAEYFSKRHLRNKK